MKKNLIAITLLISCTFSALGQKTIFYLHGAVVEGNCEHPSNGFGEYKYNEIVAALKKENFAVYSECRPANTNVKDYAQKVTQQVEGLLKKGVKPSDITVVGCSKGGMIAMYVSTYLKNPKVNFVFMSNCNETNLRENKEITFTGNVLSIFESSDNIGGTCADYKTRSTSSQLPHYKEIKLNTGLKHGYFYKPIPEWMTPTLKWANGNYN